MAGVVKECIQCHEKQYDEDTVGMTSRGNKCLSCFYEEKHKVSIPEAIDQFDGFVVNVNGALNKQATRDNLKNFLKRCECF